MMHPKRHLHRYSLNIDVCEECGATGLEIAEHNLPCTFWTMLRIWYRKKRKLLIDFYRR
jgi:ribosomal protein L40E